MIDFKNVCKSYASQDLLINATVRINQSERVGIVGPNGAGKTTIFGIITKEIYPDKGSVSIPKDLRIGYLRQHLVNDKGNVSLVDFTSDSIPRLAELHAQIHALEKTLETLTDDEKTRKLDQLGKLQHEFEHLGGYRMKNDAEAALSGLGFKKEEFNSPLSSFSGGWQMRAGLARALISNPDILLLDEPSNYLDVPAIEWLYRFLANYNGTLLLISHDRFLLKALTNITIEINGGKVTRYPGDYDFYVRERENRLIAMEAAKKNQDKKREQLERSIDRFRSKSSKATQVQSWIKSLDKMDNISLPDNLHYSGSISIPPAPHSGSEIIRLENIGMTYDGKNWVTKNAELQIERGEKIGFVGYNGSGKTTLLKIIAGAMKPTEGERVLGHKVVVGYQAQEFGEILPPESSAYEIIREAAPENVPHKNYRSILGAFGFSGEQADKPCKVLSGGEKIRLCFARIFVNPPNFLVLDEPTTHLDIAAREALQEAIRNYDGAVCLVSHDIEFIRNVATTILAMTPPTVTKYQGDYDYYREKTSGEAKAETTVNNQTAQNTQKAKRKERAFLRSQMQKTKRTAEKKTATLEKKIETLEKEKEERLDDLLKNAPGTDFAGLNKRIKDIDYDISLITLQWEEAASELEAILDEYGKIHED